MNRLQKVTYAIGFTLVLGLSFHEPAVANKKKFICEDDLTTNTNIRWGGSRKLPVKRVAEIRDCLIGSPVGSVTADRHGNSLTKIPQLSELFGGRQPYPGEAYYVSTWGSKIEGCFIEMLVQDAPINGQVNIKRLVPTKLELGVAGQPIELPANAQVEPKIFQGNYTYSDSSSGVERQISNTWYAVRNIFEIDKNIVSVLRNAPNQEVVARLTFADGSTQLLEVKSQTVQSWKEAFGFNPTCQSPEAQSALLKFQDSPLTSTLEQYDGSTRQKNALNWLQEQIPAQTLTEFAKLWRNDAGRDPNPIKIVDTFNFYNKTAVQKNAIKWLQDQLASDVLEYYLSEFL